MPIDIVCPCGKRVSVPSTLAGKRGRCKGCGEVLDIPPAGAVDLGIMTAEDDFEPAPINASAAFSAAQTDKGSPPEPYRRPDTDHPLRVVVVAFDMPFGQLVTFLVKLSLASIPATIILFLILIVPAFILLPILSALRQR